MTRKELRWPTYNEMRAQADSWHAWCIKHYQIFHRVGWTILIFFAVFGMYFFYILLSGGYIHN